MTALANRPSVAAYPALPRIFQWAGGKTKMIKHYTGLLPINIGVYVEPFAGGAALFSHLCAAKARPDRVILGDTNRELVGLYTALAHDTEGLLAHVMPYSDAWAALDPSARKATYYAWRTAYWAMAEGLEATALLYSLMRTSFNGIWQTCHESNGRFGTPAGLVNKPGGFANPEALRAWGVALQGAQLHAGSYDALDVPPGAFVFCDPPYRSSFTDYSTGFNDTDQESLVAWCRAQHRDKGATVWLANREADDGFFERTASDAQIHRFPITYTAGRRKKTATGYEAKPATELLLVWNHRTTPPQRRHV